MKILIIGPSGCGKTLAGDLIAFRRPNERRKSVSTGDILIRQFALVNDLPEDEVRGNKSEYRDELWAFGRKLQRNDPLAIVRAALYQSYNGEDGISVVTGVRNPDELQEIRNSKLFDKVIWIRRNGCGNLKTDLLTEASADVIVENNSSIEELRLLLLKAIGYDNAV